jgi:hypothetical protein
LLLLLLLFVPQFLPPAQNWLEALIVALKCHTALTCKKHMQKGFVPWPPGFLSIPLCATEHRTQRLPELKLQAAARHRGDGPGTPCLPHLQKALVLFDSGLTPVIIGQRMHLPCRAGRLHSSCTFAHIGKQPMPQVSGCLGHQVAALVAPAEFPGHLLHKQAL